jgi:hypothetical protein
MATINITVQSLLNAAKYDTQTVDTAGTIGDLKTAMETNFSYSADWFDLVFDDAVLNTANTIGSYGIVEGSALRTHNKIARLTTLQDRQLAKLDLSRLERLDLGNTRPYYDITELPTQYVGNVVVDNPNPDGLIEGRPWSAIPGSLLFSGSSELRLSTQTAFGFGTGDFTIEAFVNPTSLAGNVLFDFRSAASELAIYLNLNSSGNVRLYINGAYVITTTAAISTGAWAHIAVSRFNGSTKVFINGTQSGVTYADTNNYGTTKPLVIGASYTSASHFVGYISNIRILNGSAEYTTTFTPPVGPLPAITNTVLLLNSSFDANFLKDSSTNNFTVTNTGGVTSDALNPFPAE